MSFFSIGFSLCSMASIHLFSSLDYVKLLGFVLDRKENFSCSGALPNLLLV
jgi:hypothetical protein